MRWKVLPGRSHISFVVCSSVSRSGCVSHVRFEVTYEPIFNFSKVSASEVTVGIYDIGSFL